VKVFDAPYTALEDSSLVVAAELVAAVADIALILDHEGTILDLAFDDDELAGQLPLNWIGRPWTRVVTADSRVKIEELLAEAHEIGVRSRWQQIHHTDANGQELPVRYCVTHVGDQGRLIAVGRNLQGLTALQQRLVDAQQSLERDYWRLRQLETRYRLLFRLTSEAIMIIEPTTTKIVEVNPAASSLLGIDTRRLLGRSLLESFDRQGGDALENVIAGVRTSGRGGDTRAYLRDGRTELTVAFAPVRQENAMLMMVRLTSLHHDDQLPAVAEPRSRLLQMFERAPDGIVITHQDGRIVNVNAAFLELAQLTSEEQARSESLDRWLGRPGVDLNVLIANLRQHGTVRLFSTTIRSEYGTSSEVEISAVAVQNNAQQNFGFIIRNVDNRVPAAGSTLSNRSLPRSIEQLTELIGRVPLKEVVRESTDMIERLCIEAALELTNDNRASAAELLGLSRQSLYVKLRRYGLSDSGSEHEKITD
jgi:transcriptional regulator PpsR